MPKISNNNNIFWSVLWIKILICPLFFILWTFQREKVLCLPFLIKVEVFFLEGEGCRITKGFFLVNHLIFKYETLKYIYHFSSFDCVCVIKEKSITEIACTLILTPICFAKKKMHEFVRIQTLTFWNTSGCQSCNVFGNEYI